LSCASNEASTEKLKTMKNEIKNTTAEKQNKLIAFANEMGVTLEKLQEWYKDPVKASVLNVMAEGL